MRKPFVAGNWKMNLDRAGAIALARAVREHMGSRSGVDAAVAPPFVYLDAVAGVLAGSSVRLAAQDLCDQKAGAFTGEVAGSMLKDVGAELVIIGHSERRHVYGESDALVQRKVQRALEAGLDVILCVGETLEERRAQQTEAVVRRQLGKGLEGVDGGAIARITLAYEPVWAIGTGVNATPEQAGLVHAYLRGLLAGLYDERVAERTRIQYGGSVNADNARALLAVPDVDGALVGGASLEANQFLPILDARMSA